MIFNRLEIITLVDNYPYDKRTTSEFGYSLLISYKNHQILFNTGYSNMFLKNAKKLACDLNNVTEIIISHKHKSHSGGLPHLLRILKDESTFIIDNNYFEEYQNNNNYNNKGNIKTNNMIKKYFKRHNVTYLESGSTYYKDDIYFFLPNDRSEKKYAPSKFNIRNAMAMVIDTRKGLFLFFGAAHSRLSMILDWIEKRFPNRKIEMAFGGINVNFDRERDMDILSNSLEKVHIKHFELSHCSDKKVFEYLKNYVDNVYFNGTGKILTFHDVN